MAYKSIPNAGDFDIECVFDQTDPERGAAKGTVIIKAKRTPEQLPNMGSYRRAEVPLLIRDFRVSPLDVMTVPGNKTTSKDEFLPVTAERLREALFQPNLVEIGKEPNPVTGLYQALSAPTIGFGGMAGYLGNTGSWKVASERKGTESILTTLGADIDKSLAANVVKRASAKIGLNNLESAFLKNLQNAKGQEKWASSDIQSPGSMVVQSFFENGARLARTSSAAGFSLGEFKHAPSTVKIAQQDDGKLTTQAAWSESTVSDMPIEETASWAVKTAAGDVECFVIKDVFRPTMAKLDGMSLLFSNPSQWEVTKEAAYGKDPISFSELDLAPFNKDHPYPAFLIHRMGGNKLAAIGPIRPTSETYQGSRVYQGDLGEKFTIKQAEEVIGPVWVPSQKGLPILALPQDGVRVLNALSKHASISPASAEFGFIHSVQIESAGKGHWKIAGTALCDDLQGKVVSTTDLAYILGAARADSKWTKKLASKEAVIGCNERLLSVDDMRKIREKADTLVKKAFDENIPPLKRRNGVDLCAEMLKFAGAPDPLTLDTILSLEFITPENVGVFVDSLPTLENAVRSLSRLLIGVRLGLDEIPESTVQTALYSLEETVQGLKRIALGTQEF